MADILALLIPNVVTWCAVFALFAWDERRMTDEQRARAWPIASRRIAVVFFSPLSVPLHFLRTRRNVRGVALAVLWTVALFAVLILVGTVLDAVFPDDAS
jgi:hypothetical protein